MRTQEHVVAVHRMNDPTPPSLDNKLNKLTQKNLRKKIMDYEDLNDTMNAIIDKAQDSVENLVEQFEKQQPIVTDLTMPDGVAFDINKRDIDHAFEASRSSIEMSME